jgi:hypothetical protein
MLISQTKLEPELRMTGCDFNETMGLRITEEVPRITILGNAAEGVPQVDQLMRGGSLGYVVSV